MQPRVYLAFLDVTFDVVVVVVVVVVIFHELYMGAVVEMRGGGVRGLTPPPKCAKDPGIYAF